MDWIKIKLKASITKFAACLCILFMFTECEAQVSVNGLYTSSLPIGFEIWRSKEKHVSTHALSTSITSMPEKNKPAASNNAKSQGKTFFRSIANGNWNSLSTWESSIDNMTWSPSKTIPGGTECSVMICTPHIISTTGMTRLSIDDVLVDDGATLEIASGTFMEIARGSEFTGKDVYEKFPERSDYPLTCLNKNTAALLFKVKGDIIINQGANLSVTGTGVELQGNLICNGTYSSFDSRLLLNGEKDQSISGAGNLLTFDLELNKPAGKVTFNTNVHVNGNLNLVSGIAFTTDESKIILNQNATTTNASAKSFVNGPLQKRGNEAFNFPIGKSNNYKPVSINAGNNAPSAGVFTAEYFISDSRKSKGLIHTDSFEFWTLDLDAQKSQKNITMSWDGNSCGIINLSSLRTTRFNSSVWLDQGNLFTIGNYESGLVPGAITTNLSAYTIATINVTTPLRITLLSLKATYKGKDVNLSWVSASELYNEDFIIEHSADGSNFEPIILKTASGRNEINQLYSTDELNPMMNISYFRLKQTNLDGGHSYSDIIPIRIKRL